jgi:hypothetical protein
MNVTTRYLPIGLLAAAILLQAAPGSAQPHQIAYPEVKVVLDNPYKSDAAFDKMNGAFLNAVQRKDLAALTALVAPTFLWTVNDHPADELDLGRDAVHNFKVAFGFRAIGEEIAMPLVGFYPPEKEGTPPPSPTHFEVLLPSGRTGWVPVSAVLPLETDHLCYARTPTGEWKIGSFDQSLHAP